MSAIKQMQKTLTKGTLVKKHILSLGIAAAGLAPAFGYAQAHDAHSSHTAAPASEAASMPGMDHGSMNLDTQGEGFTTMSSTTAPGRMPTMPGMSHHNKADAVSAAPPAHDQGAMDHGVMQMQGGSAPSDARDPDAYSGGYTLGSGIYSLGPAHRLHMSDEHNFASVQFNRLEYVRAGSNESVAYEGQAWFGGTYNRMVLKAEGETAKGKLVDSRTELLWGHAISTFWDSQLGVRYDHGIGPNRGWLAFGVQGLAPYWLNVDAAAYLGSNGRTALRLSVEYDLLITQRLVLQPRGEVNFYGKRDKAREIGSGLSNGVAGLRLKYEITRQFVPYIGVEWSGKFGQTAAFAKDAGERPHETRFVAGLSFRF